MARTTTKSSAKTATGDEKPAKKTAGAKAPAAKKVAAKPAARKAEAEKPTAKASAARTMVKTAKKTMKEAISGVVGAVTRKKPASAAAPKPAAKTQAPGAPPRRNHKIATAFASALGAWAEDEAAAVARSGAEHETQRRKGAREGVSVEDIEAKKFEIQAPSVRPEEMPEVPTEYERAPLAFPMTRELEDLYDETRLTVMVRDPEWVFAYWDIDNATRERLAIPRGRHGRRMAIRWYDVTDLEYFDGANAHRVMDVEITDAARSWYQKMPEANRCWLADLGIVDEHGHFAAICRSNLARMPRMRMAPGPEEGGPEEVWMHVEHGPGAPSGKVPRKRIVKRRAGEMPQAPGRPVQPSEAVEFLGATEQRVKKVVPEQAPAPPIGLPAQLFPGASEQLMPGASEGFLGGASERLFNPKK